MMSLESLADLFLDELKDLYHAEKQLTKALPKMAKNATSEELQQAFTDHLAETEGQIERLESVFKLIEEPAKTKVCKAMKGLIEEGKELMEEDAEPSTLDAGLICGAQKVEHYEISGYGTLITWAGILGYDKKVVTLLKESLAEEKAADAKLSKIAEAINHEATVEA
jgi:ferritin-like metal-binding protein YciE